MTDPHQVSRELATAARAAGRPTEWFEQLYALAARGEADVPWQRAAPHPLLVDWANTHPSGSGRAVVVGCGLGDDAELVASLGWTTTAFDISASAVRSAKQRFTETAVDYRQANLLALPSGWAQAFDLVVESLTVQSMPPELRLPAQAGIRSLLAPGGTLVVIGMRLPGDGDLDDGPPWLLTAAEIDAYATEGLTKVSQHDSVATTSPLPRYRAEFTR